MELDVENGSGNEFASTMAHMEREGETEIDVHIVMEMEMIMGVGWKY